MGNMIGGNQLEEKKYKPTRLHFVQPGRFLHRIFNTFNNIICAKFSIQCNIKVASSAPHTVSIVVIIVGASFVFFADSLLSVLLRKMKSFRYSFYTLLKGCSKEYFKNIFIVTKNIVRTSSDNDTVTFSSKLLYSV